MNTTIPHHYSVAPLFTYTWASSVGRLSVVRGSSWGEEWLQSLTGSLTESLLRSPPSVASLVTFFSWGEEWLPSLTGSLLRSPPSVASFVTFFHQSPCVHPAGSPRRLDPAETRWSCCDTPASERSHHSWPPQYSPPLPRSPVVCPLKDNWHVL